MGHQPIARVNSDTRPRQRLAHEVYRAAESISAAKIIEEFFAASGGVGELTIRVAVKISQKEEEEELESPSDQLKALAPLKACIFDQVRAGAEEHGLNSTCSFPCPLGPDRAALRAARACPHRDGKLLFLPPPLLL